MCTNGPSLSDLCTETTLNMTQITLFHCVKLRSIHRPGYSIKLLLQGSLFRPLQSIAMLLMSYWLNLVLPNRFSGVSCCHPTKGSCISVIQQWGCFMSDAFHLWGRLLYKRSLECLVPSYRELNCGAGKCLVQGLSCFGKARALTQL